MNGDQAYADKCLADAITLFNFADNERGVYTDSIGQANGFYKYEE